MFAVEPAVAVLSENAERIWQAAGWFMVHYLWVGGIAWLIVACGRRWLHGLPSEQRHGLALASLALLVTVAFTTAVVVAARAMNADLDARLGTQSATWRFVISALPWLWIAGAATILLGTLAGTIGAQRIRRCTSICREGPLAEAGRRLTRIMRLTGKVSVGVCDRICLPVLVGILRPLIVLPASAVGGWTPRQLEMVLLHELLHVRRWDNLVILLQRSVEGVLFFHPAVWWVSHWIEQEREYRCDDFVLRRTGRPYEYAQTLVRLAEGQHSGTRLLPVASYSRPPVVDRVRRILFQEEQTMQASRLTFGVIVGGALIGAAIAGLAPPSLAANGDPVAATAQAASEVTADAQPADESFTETDAVPPSKEVRPTPALTTTAPLAVLRKPGFVQTTASGRRSWGPEQATGEPNTPGAGDSATAWASRTQDEQDEWLLCEYALPVVPKTILIHAPYNPGAVNKVSVFDESGAEIVAWEGEDPTPRNEPRGISVIPVKIEFPIKKIKVYIASIAVPGWNEIDAVGLGDAEGGTHWAVKVEASSTYAEPEVVISVVAPGNRSWGPEQAQGEPNTPDAGDFGTAWASETVDGQPEWLICTYDIAQIPSAIAIHESYNPGAVHKVSAFNEQGQEIVIWEGDDPTPRDVPKGISVIPVEIGFPTSKIKIYLDSPAVPGWNEIDAVAMRDAQGQPQWASKVEASSTFAQYGATTTPLIPPVSAEQLQQLEQQVRELQAQVQELQKLRDEIKELKALIQQLKAKQ